MVIKKVNHSECLPFKSHFILLKDGYTSHCDIFKFQWRLNFQKLENMNKRQSRNFLFCIYELREGHIILHILVHLYHYDIYVVLKKLLQRLLKNIMWNALLKWFSRIKKKVKLITLCKICFDLRTNSLLWFNCFVQLNQIIPTNMASLATFKNHHVYVDINFVQQNGFMFANQDHFLYSRISGRVG